MKPKLLTKKLRATIPLLGATARDADPIVRVQFFTPTSSWNWWVLEFDGVEKFYGLVDGESREHGFFYLSELEEVRGRFGLGVERNQWFEACRVSRLPSFRAV